MYDEIVKRLRDMARSDGNIKSNYIGLSLLQAADAIEELQQTIEQMKATTIAEAKHMEMYDECGKRTLIEMAKSLPLQIIPYNDKNLVGFL